MTDSLTAVEARRLLPELTAAFMMCGDSMYRHKHESGIYVPTLDALARAGLMSPPCDGVRAGVTWCVHPDHMESIAWLETETFVGLANDDGEPKYLSRESVCAAAIRACKAAL